MFTANFMALAWFLCSTGCVLYVQEEECVKRRTEKKIRTAQVLTELGERSLDLIW